MEDPTKSGTAAVVIGGATLAGTIAVVINDGDLTGQWSAFVRMQIVDGALIVSEVDGDFLREFASRDNVCDISLDLLQTATLDRGRYSRPAAAASGNLSLGGTSQTTTWGGLTQQAVDENGQPIFDGERPVMECIGVEVNQFEDTVDNLVTVQGRHVFQDGRLIAIDFANVPGSTTVVGRLELVE